MSKPCPFCGGTPAYSVGWHRVVCAICDAEGPVVGSHEEAAPAWNRRASPWVPVGEGLPPIDSLSTKGDYRFSEEVLIFADGNRHVASLWRLKGQPIYWELELPHGALDADGKDLGGIVTSLELDEVSKWAPLPDPPEERP